MASKTFTQMFEVFKRLGDVEEENLKFTNGKDSKFIGRVSSKAGEKKVNLGILHYDWNRSIGVDKINQAIQQTEKAGLDGALMVGNKFSRSAIEQAYRINESSSKRIVLMDSEEINAAYDTFNA